VLTIFAYAAEPGPPLPQAQRTITSTPAERGPTRVPSSPPWEGRPCFVGRWRSRVADCEAGLRAGGKQRNPPEEEIRRYEEETRQRHPSEDEVASLEEEAQGGDQQSGDDD
jgi:hypothetical protein